MGKVDHSGSYLLTGARQVFEIVKLQGLQLFLISYPFRWSVVTLFQVFKKKLMPFNEVTVRVDTVLCLNVGCNN